MTGAAPCWDSGEVGCYARALLELPPIKDPAMNTTYPAARERVHTAHLCRTPIDPVARILSPGLMKGNTDLQPAMSADVPAYRDCTVCAGRGVTGNPLPNLGGHLQCPSCKGAGRVPR